MHWWGAATGNEGREIHYPQRTDKRVAGWVRGVQDAAAGRGVGEVFVQALEGDADCSAGL